MLSGGQFANLRVGKRRRKPRPHEAEPISVDTIDNGALIDGDPSHVVEPHGLPGRGERAMLASLLSCAIEEARRGDGEALAWLVDDAEVGQHGTFTVVQVLDHLGLDRDAFVERLYCLLRRGEQRQDAAPPGTMPEDARFAA